MALKWTLDVPPEGCALTGLRAPVDAAYDRAYPYRAVGEILALRSMLGLTQAELAAKAGVSLSAISRAERGRSCSMDLLDRIATATGRHWRPMFYLGTLADLLPGARVGYERDWCLTLIPGQPVEVLR